MVEAETFRLSANAWEPWFLIPSLLWSLGFGLYFGLLTGVIFFGLFSLVVVLNLRMTRYHIGRDGITVGLVDHLRWADVKAARRKRFLGREYIHVTRTTGFPWWIPLDLIGNRDIRSALSDFVPNDNPIRTCIE